MPVYSKPMFMLAPQMKGIHFSGAINKMSLNFLWNLKDSLEFLLLVGNVDSKSFQKNIEELLMQRRSTELLDLWKIILEPGLGYALEFWHLLQKLKILVVRRPLITAQNEVFTEEREYTREAWKKLHE